MRITHPRLPAWAPVLVGVLAVAAGCLVTLSGRGGPTGAAATAAGTYLVMLPMWSRLVEGRRAALDRLATALVWAALALVLVPLSALAWTVVSHGAKIVDVQFLTYSMRNIVGPGGGVYHAIVGTLLVTGAAALISIPIGVATAVYLTEYGQRDRAGHAITFLVDVMTGIPSIVAGLFAYALFVLFFGPGVRMGFGGAIALSLLMIPIVVRSAEQVFRLVPDELREAAYALGVRKWRTVLQVVLPTALPGLITGITLAVARVVGETAPLLIIAGATSSTNTNLFGDRMMTLPVFIYYSYTQPGVPASYGQARAWGAALLLVAIVMALNLGARLAGRFILTRTR